MLSQQDKKAIYNIMLKYESSVPHMYLDSKGLVTVGIGHLISTVADAQKLTFYTAKNTLASAAEIKSDFDNVKKQHKNFKATYYKRFTKLTMKQIDIDKITNAHIDTFYRELKQIYSGFDTYPKAAQYALFDLIFNLGKSKLDSGFPTLKKAVLAHAWPIAANESNRKPPVSAERNQFVKDLFNKAADQAAGSASSDANLIANLF